MFNSNTSVIVVKTINVNIISVSCFWLIFKDNQNAKFKLKLCVKLLTKFSNIPVKCPLKSIWAERGVFFNMDLMVFHKIKLKYLVMVNKFWIVCLITASFQASRQNHTLFWQKKSKKSWEEVEMIWKSTSNWSFTSDKIQFRVIKNRIFLLRKQQYF